MKSTANRISQVLCTDVATKVVSQSSKRMAIAFTNGGPNTVFLVTDPSAPATSGFAIKVTDSPIWLCADGFAGLITSDIFGVCSAASSGSLGIIETFAYGD